MEKCFKYRKHIKKMAKITPFILLPLGIYFTVEGLFTDDTLFTYLGVIIFFHGLFSPRVLKRLYTTELRISEDGISYCNNVDDIQFTFYEIIEIKSKTLMYFSGWMIIKVNDKKPIRLTVVVEDLATFIRILKKALDDRDMSDKYNEDKLKALYLTSFYINYSWERAPYFAPKFFPTILIQAIVIILISVFTKYNENIIALSPFIIGIIPYIYYEYGIYVKNIRKKAKTDGWNVEIPDSELAIKRMKKAYRYYLYIGIAGILIQLLLGILY